MNLPDCIISGRIVYEADGMIMTWAGRGECLTVRQPCISKCAVKGETGLLSREPDHATIFRRVSYRGNERGLVACYLLDGDAVETQFLVSRAYKGVAVYW